MAIDIVDLPSYKMVMFHSHVSFPEGKHIKPAFADDFSAIGQWFYVVKPVDELIHSLSN